MKKAVYAGALLLACAVPLAVFASTLRTVDRTPPSVVSLSIQSNGSNPTQAVSGNVVTLSFTTSEKVEPPIVLVNARPVILRATNAGGNAWTASYTITSNDPLGTANYLITLQDESGNLYACSNVKTAFQILVKYCPTTDGSSVTVVKTQTPPPPPPPPPSDTTPPVIAQPSDVVAYLQHVSQTSIAVNYTTPTATDNVDGTDPVSCMPASGSSFSQGTTTVTCTSQDAAGNHATPVTFGVGVYPFVPQPTVLSQSMDESSATLCGDEWVDCYQNSDIQTFSLGQGSGLQGLLQSVTVALDGADYASYIVQSPWILGITCSTDANNTTPCSDWTPQNVQATVTSDNKNWTANFSGATFNPNEYYWLVINDHGLPVPAYGSATEPYWLVEGLTQ